MATQRAPKGGAFGANGEWYEGGKFINSVASNPKKEGSDKHARKPCKQQVAPGVWEVTERTPLFSLIGAGAFWDRKENKMVPYMPCFRNGFFYGGQTMAEMQAACDAYNNGLRFFDEIQ